MSNPFELTSESVINSLAIIENVLQQASTMSLSPLYVDGVLNAVDSIGVYLDNLKSNMSEIMGKSARILNDFGRLVASDLNPGEEEATTIGGTFRVMSKTTLVADNNLTVSAPLNELEQLNGKVSSVVSLPMDPAAGELLIGVSLLLMNARNFGRNSGYLSDPLHISVSASNISAVYELIFSVPRLPTPPLEITLEHFSTSCLVGVSMEETYTCNVSGFVLNHTCLGMKAVSLTSYCPPVLIEPECSPITMGYKSSELECIASSTTESSMTCSCVFSSMHTAGADNRRRLLDSGTLKRKAAGLAVTTRYFGDQFAGTISSVGSFNSVATYKKVFGIFVLYASLWSCAGLLMLFAQYHDSQNERTSKKASSSEVNLKQKLMTYLLEVIPNVFRKKPVLENFFSELIVRHKYFGVFATGGFSDSNEKKVLGMIYFVTLHSMQFFLLAVFYELQGPDDDGSCATHVNEKECESARSFLDQSQHYCQWIESKTSCFYVPPHFSWFVTVYIIVIVSMCTALLSGPINICFNILQAPLADPRKLKDRMSGVRRRLFNVVRKASAFVVDPFVAAFRLRALKRVARSTMAGFTTREMPDSAISAYDAIRADTAEVQRRSTRSVSRLSEILRTVESSLERSNDEIRHQLENDILTYRQHLSEDDRCDFDAKWGLSKSGIFSTCTRRTMCGMKSEQMASSVLVLSCIEECHEVVVEKSKALEFSFDRDIGLELIHLFIMDLLGRNTPAAKIFRAKTNEDFRRKTVVLRSVKLLTWTAVLFFNAFFMIFVLLRSTQRQSSWQHGFITGCVVQFVVELCLNETVECLWVNYLVPSVAAQEVQRAMTVLLEAADALCQEKSMGDQTLNAPDYLFASTNLAKKYPDLQESLVILSYSSPFPGELSKQWKDRRQYRQLTSSSMQHALSKLFSIVTSLIVALQFLAATPVFTQRLILRLVQPWIVIAVTFLFYFIINNKAILSVAIVVIVGGIAGTIYYFRRKSSTERNITRPSEAIGTAISGYDSPCLGPVYGHSQGPVDMVNRVLDSDKILTRAAEESAEFHLGGAEEISSESSTHGTPSIAPLMIKVIAEPRDNSPSAGDGNDTVTPHAHRMHDHSIDAGEQDYEFQYTDEVAETQSQESEVPPKSSTFAEMIQFYKTCRPNHFLFPNDNLSSSDEEFDPNTIAGGCVSASDDAIEEPQQQVQETPESSPICLRRPSRFATSAWGGVSAGSSSTAPPISHPQEELLRQHKPCPQQRQQDVLAICIEGGSESDGGTDSGNSKSESSSDTRRDRDVDWDDGLSSESGAYSS